MSLTERFSACLCNRLGHSYQRCEDDPLQFDCSRCDATWNVREELKNPPTHRPSKGTFRSGGAPYCEACGKSLDLKGNRPEDIRLTDISRFSYYTQHPGRDEVLLDVGCRFSLFALGDQTSVKCVLDAIDAPNTTPTDLQYGRTAKYGRYAKD